MTLHFALVGLILLCACVPRQEDSVPVAQVAADATVHSFAIERAYSLTDPRELAFRDQIAAAAREVCGFGGFSLYSSRPVGVEEVRDDALYRLYEVAITCTP